MKKSIGIKSLSLVIITVLAASLLFTACGSSDSKNDTSAKSSNLKGSVLIVGSTSVQPLAQDLADSFNDIEKDVKIDVQGGGSSVGVSSIQKGTCDIGTSSRELTADEKKTGLTETVIAYDGIAVVIHPGNKVTNLTQDQITKIFSGEIKNWKDIGGADKDILVVSREESSGTRTAFQELLKLQKKDGTKTISLIKSDALVVSSNGEVKTNVASKENAIGYLSLGVLDKTIKAVTVDGKEATEANVKNKTYTISRPFLMLTKGDMKPELKAFIDYILSDKGQAIVAKNYVTLK
jgi:phosphate transport system substrate-binding protein